MPAAMRGLKLKPENVTENPLLAYLSQVALSAHHLYFVR